MRVAAIDIGTNSTRLLVADVAVPAEGAGGAGPIDGPTAAPTDGQTAPTIQELFRRSVVTRLGDRVDETGELSTAARERVLEVLAGFRDEFNEAGVERVAGVATSAVRDAANGEAFVAEIGERLSIEIQPIAGDREARLTFAGACSGDVMNDSPSVVIDIGGGSTEFITGEARRSAFHVSTDIGAVRHSERFLVDDPPTQRQVDDLLAAAAAEIRARVPAAERARATHGVAVAGTPTVLASVDQALEQFDPWKVHGYKITAAACERLLRRLAALPLAERRKVVGLHPDRAPTIVAGAAILLAAMREFDLTAVTVSEHDILYGIALESVAR